MKTSLLILLIIAGALQTAVGQATLPIPRYNEIQDSINTILPRQNQTLKDANSRLKKSIAELQKKIESQSSQSTKTLQSKNEQIGKADTRITQLTADVQQKKTSSADLRARIKRFTDVDSPNLVREIQSRQASIDKLTKDATDHDKDAGILKSLTDSLNNVSKDSSALITQIAELDKNINATIAQQKKDVQDTLAKSVQLDINPDRKNYDRLVQLTIEDLSERSKSILSDTSFNEERAASLKAYVTTISPFLPKKPEIDLDGYLSLCKAVQSAKHAVQHPYDSVACPNILESLRQQLSVSTTLTAPQKETVNKWARLISNYCSATATCRSTLEDARTDININQQEEAYKNLLTASKNATLNEYPFLKTEMEKMALKARAFKGKGKEFVDESAIKEVQCKQ
ncbi:MAG: hypothetical protein JST68_27225 [Bacteroidetes bacterium]|nr:hypothetical protein [Bacteroidota bacterium]